MDSAEPPPTIGSLLPRALQDPAKLVAELGGWVVVGAAPSADAEEWTFRTVSSRTVRDESGAIEAILDETFVVYPLKKMKAGPWASTILVGRSRTNDVCIAHSSVSKLHARVRIGPDGLFLSDAGSSNGTAVNGEAIKPETEHRLSHATQLRFGAKHFQVFEPGRFVDLLSRFSKTYPAKG